MTAFFSHESSYPIYQATGIRKGNHFRHGVFPRKHAATAFTLFVVSTLTHDIFNIFQVSGFSYCKLLVTLHLNIGRLSR